MFNRIATKALVAGLLMASATTLAAQSYSERESGFIKANSPVCPTEQDLRAVWAHFYGFDVDAALALMIERGCIMFEQDMMYGTVDEGRIDDHSAKVAGVYVVGNKVDSFKGYTASGGMLCLINCPPEAVIYHDHYSD